jgi:hypothetical protein
MDNDILERIAHLLAAYPAEWDSDDDIVDELIIEAVEQEAVGVPLAQHNPQLAAFLRIHVDKAEEYQALRWLHAQPLDVTTPRRQAHTSATTTPAGKASLINKINNWLFPPLRLSLGSALRKAGEQGSAKIKAAQRVFPLEVAPFDLVLEVELQRQDDLGAIVLRLTPGNTSEPVLLEQAEARLYTTSPDEGPAVAEPLETRRFAGTAPLVFAELEPTDLYHLVVLLGNGQPLIVAIEPAWWP